MAGSECKQVVTGNTHSVCIVDFDIVSTTDKTSHKYLYVQHTLYTYLNPPHTSTSYVAALISRPD